MKKLSIITIALLLTGGPAFAQTPAQQQPTIINGGQSHIQLVEGHEPLYAFFIHDKMVYVSHSQADGLLQRLDPNNIKAINVLKDSSAVKQYGSRGQYGVIEIYLEKSAKLDTPKIKTESL